MNWRQLVILYAAQILEQFGERDFAKALRSYRVPLIDGGNVRRAKRAVAGLQVEPGGYQHLVKPDNSMTWLLELPANLWDPPKEGRCCNHECCRVSA